MKLHFLGANRQVTGSRYCVEVGEQRVLVDCGMFQERDFLSRNWEISPIRPQDISAMLLTHVHIDHSGLIPKLVKDGFRKPIYATEASVQLVDIMLRDSAEIQMEDAAYKRKRHAREGRTGRFAEDPLYTTRDVDQSLPLFRGVPYGKLVNVTDQVSVTFFDAGHILGSAMLDVAVQENGKTIHILFSGDIGQWKKPIIRDPTLFDQADYVVMESTYGNRDHEEGGDIETQLADVIQRTAQRGGKVIIPTFAVERAQELMYFLGRLVRAGRIPSMPIFLDSPMAVDVTAIYRRCHDYFDQETWEMINAKQPPWTFPGLQMASSPHQSKAINAVRGPAVIMASSGMCNAGRIKHHLRQHLSDAANTILFVGYQAAGTLGRQILDRKSPVRIHGRDQLVLAEVAQIFGFSGHADRTGLLYWISNLKSPPKQIFLTHGEEAAAVALSALIQTKLAFEVTIPNYGQIVEIEG